MQTLLYFSSTPIWLYVLIAAMEKIIKQTYLAPFACECSKMVSSGWFTANFAQLIHDDAWWAFDLNWLAVGLSLSRKVVSHSIVVTKKKIEGNSDNDKETCSL